MITFSSVVHSGPALWNPAKGRELPSFILTQLTSVGYRLHAAPCGAVKGFFSGSPCKQALVENQRGSP